jgi:hypothetical protein
MAMLLSKGGKALYGGDSPEYANIVARAKANTNPLSGAASGIAGVVKKAAPLLLGNVPVVGGLLDKIPGFSGGNLGDMVSGGVKRLSGLMPDSLSGAFGDLGGVGDLAGKAWDFAKGHPDELLAGAQGLYGAHAANKANQLRKRSLETAEGSYKERAPLRRMGVAGMMNPSAPDTSGIIDSANPYARKRTLRRIGGM